MRRKLLLHSGGDIRSAFDDIAAHFNRAQSAVFLPFALHDHDAYAALITDRFAPLGVRVTSAHTALDPVQAVAECDGIIVGGGNTFRLLRALHERGLVPAIRERAASGVPYFGASAGSNVASPTIRTTNDMPIVETESLRALDLVPFQINPHYVDPPAVRVGETRAERLHEFLEENDVAVIGLREPSWVVVNDDQMELRGSGGAALFQRGREVEELVSGSDVSRLLTFSARFDRTR